MKPFDPSLDLSKSENNRNLDISDEDDPSEIKETGFSPFDSDNEIRVDNEHESSEDDANEYEIDRILDHRVTNNQLRYLVHWKGYHPRYNSWVDETDIHASKSLAEHNTRRNARSDITTNF